MSKIIVDVDFLKIRAGKSELKYFECCPHISQQYTEWGYTFDRYMIKIIKYLEKIKNHERLIRPTRRKNTIIELYRAIKIITLTEQKKIYTTFGKENFFKTWNKYLGISENNIETLCSLLPEEDRKHIFTCSCIYNRIVINNITPPEHIFPVIVDMNFISLNPGILLKKFILEKYTKWLKKDMQIYSDGISILEDRKGDIEFLDYYEWIKWRIPLSINYEILPLNDRPLPTCEIKKSRIKIAKWLCI